MPAGCQAPAWRQAVRTEVLQGQRRILDSLLLHDKAKLFCHRRAPAQDEEAGKSQENPTQSEKVEEAVQNAHTEISNEDVSIKENVIEDKAKPTLLFASGAFTNQILVDSGPRPQFDSLTGESVLSFSTSVPSSLSTDRPPSPLSNSSHGPGSNHETPVEEVDPRKFLPCRVNLRPLALATNRRTKVLYQEMEEESSISTTDSSMISEDFEDLCEYNDDIIGSSVLEKDDCLEADFALDLDELKTLVENRGCSSIIQLHLNINKIIKKWCLPEGHGHEERQELVTYYQQLLEEVFPWFDINEPGRHWAEWQPRPTKRDGDEEGLVQIGQKRKFHVARPNNEHSYAMQKTNPHEKYTYNDEDDTDNKENYHDDGDCRKCLFCGEVGNQEIKLAGRLISLR